MKQKEKTEKKKAKKERKGKKRGRQIRAGDKEIIMLMWKIQICKK